MAVSKVRGVIGMAAASAMLFSSTGAIASTAPVAQTQASPWAVLGVMSGGASAVATCGAAAAAAVAAQPAAGCVLPQVDVVPVAQVEPVPIAPVEAMATPFGINPLLLGLAALAAGLGLYFAIRDDDDDNANSPA